MEALRPLQRHRLSDLGRHRQDHHQPARGPQRVQADHRIRDVACVRGGAGRPHDRRDHPHRGGAGLLARIVGQKKAREIWFLCEQYDAHEALAMGLVNKVVPLADLEKETVVWCRRMLELSPLALRMLKAGLNAADDGLAGIQQLAGDATLLYYLSEEAQEGRDAYMQKRKPNFSKFPKRP